MKRKEAIEFVAKNCYNGVTPEQVAEVLSILEKLGMQPPLLKMGTEMVEGVSFKYPVYRWEDSVDKE
jgi:hypothetical protein